MIDWSLATFTSIESVQGIVVVVPRDFVEPLKTRLHQEGRYTRKLLNIVPGGETRQESVLNGLRSLPVEASWVAVHDAARPYSSPQLIEATFALAQQGEGAIPCVAIHDTLVHVDSDGFLVRPISREMVKRAQTPQIFRADVLLAAHMKAKEQTLLFTDDATLVSYFGHKVATFVHFGENRKVTTPQDLEKITMQSTQKADRIRCGQGFDVHPLVEGRPLILGGVKFPGEKGLAGHSDADVLSHAICDALLGAAALGDIGQHFPPTDPAYKNISSLVLLEETVQLLREKGYEPVFVDSTVICEHPKINARRDEMRERIAGAISIDPESISVKATTPEHLGALGREEGIAAMAVATVHRIEQEG